MADTPAVILNAHQLSLTLNRLCFQLIENHDDFENSVLIGMQPRGVYLANRMRQLLEKLMPGSQVPCGTLDITFFRDDFRRKNSPLTASSTDIDFSLEDKRVVLVDDVLYTGRTIRAGLDAMLTFGRPQSVELLVLIDRRFKRQLPVQANYIGKYVDSIARERVAVEWKETDGNDQVILFTPATEHESTEH